MNETDSPNVLLASRRRLDGAERRAIRHSLAIGLAVLLAVIAGVAWDAATEQHVAMVASLAP